MRSLLHVADGVSGNVEPEEICSNAREEAGINQPSGKGRRVSELHGIPKVNVGIHMEMQRKILCHMSGCEKPGLVKKCKIVREPQFEAIDEACYVWFAQQRALSVSVSGSLLQEKALALFPSLYPNEDRHCFKASSGWLQKFCKRHGIHFMTLQGEGLSATSEDVEHFRQELETMLDREGYSKDQIFNAYETGLWWRLFPSRSFVCSNERKAMNLKKSKDRVTLIACTNASGTFRMPLAFHTYSGTSQ